MKKPTMTTISWKFKDITESYPELTSIKDTKITNPHQMYTNFKFIFDHEVHEKFVVFWLNSANKVIGYEVVSQGILNSSVVAPREIFRGAIVSSCASIIVAHNHPSGNSEPSNEDIAITKKLAEAGKILDISLFDHIIFTDSGFTSFQDKRLL